MVFSPGKSARVTCEERDLKRECEEAEGKVRWGKCLWERMSEVRALLLQEESRRGRGKGIEAVREGERWRGESVLKAMLCSKREIETHAMREQVNAMPCSRLIGRVLMPICILGRSSCPVPAPAPARSIRGLAKSNWGNSYCAFPLTPNGGKTPAHVMPKLIFARKWQQQLVVQLQLQLAHATAPTTAPSTPSATAPATSTATPPSTPPLTSSRSCAAACHVRGQFKCRAWEYAPFWGRDKRVNSSLAPQFS